MAVDTVAVWKKTFPAANPTLLQQVDAYVKQYAPQFALTTPQRVAAFMAQGGHETDGYKTLREYASGQAYEGRKDLGNIYKGDGVKYKGRGVFQITGRANYALYSKKIFGNENTLLNNPALLEQPQYAVLSALHFWTDRNLNAYADKGDITGMTKRINGGTNGLNGRVTYFNAINASIAAVSPTLFIASFLIDNSKKKVNNNSNNTNATPFGLLLSSWWKKIF